MPLAGNISPCSQSVPLAFEGKCLKSNTWHNWTTRFQSPADSMEEFLWSGTKSERWLKNPGTRKPWLSGEGEQWRPGKNRKHRGTSVGQEIWGRVERAAGKRCWEIHKLGLIFVADMKIFLAGVKIFVTRSLKASRGPTSSWRTFGTLEFVLYNLWSPGMRDHHKRPKRQLKSAHFATAGLRYRHLYFCHNQQSGRHCMFLILDFGSSL